MVETISYDTLELQIKAEQGEQKKGLSQRFIGEVNEYVEMCFMLPKYKKENFITREKLKLNLYKLIRTQKKFKEPENIFGSIRYLAVYDKATDEIGKLLSIDFINNTAEYVTYYDVLNSLQPRTKHWRDIYLFDYNSQQLGVMYHTYHQAHQRELSYVEMANFLEINDFTRPTVNHSVKIEHPEDEYGIELVNAEEHPVMKEIMIEYKIPESTIKKKKKRLLQLDEDTMKILGDFGSVKTAAEQLNISASTISNVLCQGNSASKYKEAGGFRWQYSDRSNDKYGNISNEINEEFNK